MSHPQPPSSHHACAAFNQIVNQPSPLAHAHLGYAEMESIDRELGESLEWERLDDRVASRIAITDRALSKTKIYVMNAETGLLKTY
jgi:hypothetical protein